MARVIIWKVEHGPYPWRFAIEHAGIRRDFAGIPNKCETRRSAAIRGWWRLRWLEDGTFKDKYK